MRKGILSLVDIPQDGVVFFQLYMLTKHPFGTFAHSW
jgi:hypothetical protein